MCTAAVDAGWEVSRLPLACRLPPPLSPISSAGWPRVHGHAYASTDPHASAAFAIKYLGAALVYDSAPHCPGPPDARAPREVTVRLPTHGDYRGGGLVLRFVSNPRKHGGDYDIAAHVSAMHVLFGNLSDNRHHQCMPPEIEPGRHSNPGGKGAMPAGSRRGFLSRQRSSADSASAYFAPPRLRSWNQFFDSHLGFYARPSDEIARDLLRDGCGPLGFGCMRATGSIACEWQCCRARLPHFCTAAHGVPPAEWSGEPSHLHQPI